MNDLGSLHILSILCGWETCFSASIMWQVSWTSLRAQDYIPTPRTRLSITGCKYGADSNPRPGREQTQDLKRHPLCQLLKVQEVELIMGDLCTSRLTLVTGTMEYMFLNSLFLIGGIARQIITIKAPSCKLALKQGKQTYSDQALMYNQISHGSGLLLEFLSEM
ncbi:hypothetical protein OIU85_024756 [Salix viminalis]|uniref:Uncharacterized protein n=1 Tax=Salix viminalis TaxID=40686 RepID=A0A9Q0Z506_SALVM|nr:hypothetical protein OIU85_024756 [Salix viminalis]